MQLRFDRRVAIVTGAGRGLGRAYARLLAERGATVVVNDLGGGPFGGGGSTEPAAQTAAEIVAGGGRAIANFGDVSRAGDASMLVEQALEAFGGIDIVINNAGIFSFLAFESVTRSDLDEMHAINVGGSFEITRAAWPHLVERGYGRVVMTSSSAVLGVEDQSHYVAAKAALVGLTRALAAEGQAHGITVNAIMPVAWTRLVAEAREAAGRPGAGRPNLRPELVAPVVAWLAHEDCPASGELIAAAAGYVGRVFVAQTQGHFDRQLSIESVRDHWPSVMAEDGCVIASRMSEIVALMLRGAA